MQCRCSGSSRPGRLLVISVQPGNTAGAHNSLGEGSYCQESSMVHLLLVGSLVHLRKVGVTRLEAVGSIGCQCHTRCAHQPSNLEPNAAGCVGHVMLLGLCLSAGLRSQAGVPISSWGCICKLLASYSTVHGKSHCPSLLCLG